MVSKHREEEMENPSITPGPEARCTPAPVPE